MTKIDYDHSRNAHSRSGPAAAFPAILQVLPAAPRSLIDVGCGTGTWLSAAINSGLTDVAGVDGIAVSPDMLAVSQSLISVRDLTKPLEFSRRFDVALCLEVAEHLDADCAEILVSSLTGAADTVVFSAACPEQPGQHHVNCQWPEYWQGLFNARGYACDDTVRWRIWSQDEIEPWYRQNMFIARCAPDDAGKEPRILPVMHPGMAMAGAMNESARKRWATAIAWGAMPIKWYCTVPFTALVGKLSRVVGGWSSDSPSRR